MTLNETIKNYGLKKQTTDNFGNTVDYELYSAVKQSRKATTYISLDNCFDIDGKDTFRLLITTIHAYKKFFNKRTGTKEPFMTMRTLTVKRNNEYDREQ